MDLNFIILQATMSDVDYLNVNQIQKEIVGSLGPLIGVGRTVAGLGSLIYLTTTIIDGMNTGRYDWLATLRPFLLFFVIAFYPSFLVMLNVIIEPMNRAGDGMATSQYTLYQAEYAKVLTSIKKYEDGNDAIDVNMVDKIVMAFDVLKLTFIAYLYKLVMMLCWLIVNVLTFIILLIRALYLAFLYVFGPIAIGISAFPIFEDNWKSWLAKYISISLWYPIAQVIYYVCLKINTLALVRLNQVIAERPDNIELSDFTICLLAAVSGVIVLQTPTIASMILSESTGGMISKFISNSATGGKALKNVTSPIGNSIKGFAKRNLY